MRKSAAHHSRTMRLRILFVAFTILGVSHGLDYTCEAAECADAALNFNQTIDFDVDPCHDFYSFACGRFIKHTNISEASDETIYEFAELIEEEYLEKFENHLSGLSEWRTSAVEDDTARKLWSLCMNINDGKEVNDQFFADIGTIPFVLGMDPKTVLENPLVEALRENGNPLFIMTYNSPCDYCSLKIAPALAVYRYTDDYAKQMKFLIELATVMARDQNVAFNLDATTVRVKRFLALQADMAELIAKSVQNRSPSAFVEVENAHMKILWPFFDLLSFDAKETQVVNEEVYFYVHKEYVAGISKLFEKHGFAAFADYLGYANIHKMYMYLGPEYRSLVKKHFGVEKSLRKFCTKKIAAVMPRYTDKWFYEQFVSSQDIDAANSVFANIRAAFEEEIRASSWLSAASKRAFVEKIYALNVIYGPTGGYYSAEDFQKRYANWDVLDSARSFYAFANALEKEWDSERQLPDHGFAKIHVNGAYGAGLNRIHIELGHLVKPFFHHNFPLEMQYGSLGKAIALQMAHAFNPMYIKIYTNLLRSSEIPLYEERVNCLLAQFNATRRFDFSRQKSIDNFGTSEAKFTVPDNMALQVTVKAYKKAVSAANRTGDIHLSDFDLHGTQLFYAAYAQLHCSKSEDDEAFQKWTGRPANKHRVNEALKNDEHFRAAFSCPDWSHMVPWREQCRFL